VPAAAVIPAPIAYTKVVAFKKLVVGSRVRIGGPPFGRDCRLQPTFRLSLDALHWVSWVAEAFTLKKLECSRRAHA
jgi:hypothetical protein